MNFYSVFADHESCEGLQHIYARDELEVMALFKIALDVMNTYNMKIGSMRRTKEIIKDNMGVGEYNEWSLQYPDRKPMEMKVISVSIVILLLKNFFLFFFLN